MSQGRNIFCDNRISFQHVHSYIIIAFVTIRAPVFGFIVVRYNLEPGTRQFTDKARHRHVHGILDFVLIYATLFIVNDFYRYPVGLAFFP